MNNFFQGSIELEEFETNWILVWRETIDKFNMVSKDLKQIDNFHPNPESSNFGHLMASLYRLFEGLEDEYFTQQEAKEFINSI